MKLICETSLADGGNENRIFRCLSTELLQNSVDIETTANPCNRKAAVSIKERFTLKSCVHTYRAKTAKINPATPPVRTYMAKRRKTRLYEVEPQLPRP